MALKISWVIGEQRLKSCWIICLMNYVIAVNCTCSYGYNGFNASQGNKHTFNVSQDNKHTFNVPQCSN